jgi:DNA helicase-2/ATP-dependent DNA helicase PcrA
VPPDYLTRLNQEQRDAVESVDGPLLVLAGAGTGKTRVLTTRFAHILLSGRAAPGQVLAVTFTNKAAKEMRERVGAILGRPVEGLWLGTFHALCARMLRRHAEHVGLTSAFSILDSDDQMRLLKQVMEAARVDTKRWAPQALMGMIQRWKDRGLTPDRVTPAEGAERHGFRRPDAAHDGDIPYPSRRAGAVSPHVPLRSGGRIPGHERGAVPVAAAAGAAIEEYLLRRG